MPRRTAGKTKERGSAGGPAREHQFQLTEYQIPVLASGVPVLHDPLRGQVQHSAERIVIGKGRLVFRDLPELAVQALNNIGRVYDLPNLQGIFKEGAEDLPVLLPAFDAGGILLPPAFREVP